jgi:hypothetical protein
LLSVGYLTSESTSTAPGLWLLLKDTDWDGGEKNDCCSSFVASCTVILLSHAEMTQSILPLQWDGRSSLRNVSSSSTAMTDIGTKACFEWQAFLSQMVPNQNSPETLQHVPLSQCFQNNGQKCCFYGTVLLP